MIFNKKPKPIIVVTVAVAHLKNDKTEIENVLTSTYKSVKNEVGADYYIIVMAGDKNEIEVK